MNGDEPMKPQEWKQLELVALLEAIADDKSESVHTRLVCATAAQAIRGAA